MCDFKAKKLDFQSKFDFRCWILGVNFWLQCVDRFQSWQCGTWADFIQQESWLSWVQRLVFSSFILFFVVMLRFCRGYEMLNIDFDFEWNITFRVYVVVLLDIKFLIFRVDVIHIFILSPLLLWVYVTCYSYIYMKRVLSVGWLGGIIVVWVMLL